MKLELGDIVYEKATEWRGQIIGKGKEKDWKVRFRKGQKDEYEEKEFNEYELWSEKEYNARRIVEPQAISFPPRRI